MRKSKICSPTALRLLWRTPFPIAYPFMPAWMPRMIRSRLWTNFCGSRFRPPVLLSGLFSRTPIWSGCLRKKAPVMLSAEDTTLELNDVLNPDGVLRLNGTNLLFDRKDPDCGCLIEGTRSGETAQTQFASVSNTEVLLVPHIPTQDDPWNNEYTVSIHTRYTENGSIRTGTYGRRLRSPLVLNGFSSDTPHEVGILTGNAPAPYVVATSAEMTADEQIRIQAIFDLTDNRLTLSLQAMENAAPQAMRSVCPATAPTPCPASAVLP